MDSKTLMKCGCVAQGVLSGRGGVALEKPIPACVVHDCYEVASAKPDLAGRMSKCSDRCKIVPSSYVGLIDCPCCEGSGVTGETVTVYERGCCAPHDDVIEHRCDECGGTGEVWADDEMGDDEDWTAAIWGEHSQFGVGA